MKNHHNKRNEALSQRLVEAWGFIKKPINAINEETVHEDIGGVSDWLHIDDDGNKHTFNSEEAYEEYKDREWKEKNPEEYERRKASIDKEVGAWQQKNRDANRDREDSTKAYAKDREARKKEWAEEDALDRSLRARRKKWDAQNKADDNKWYNKLNPFREGEGDS